MMSQTYRSKRLPRTRSSKIVCQEKFACPSVGTEAVYFCEDCQTNQCETCEKKLHGTKETYRFHERTLIRRVSPEKLCQNSCKERNFADVHCVNCNCSYCNECFGKHHQIGTLRKHVTRPLEEASKTSTEVGDLPQEMDMLKFRNVEQPTSHEDESVGSNIYHSVSSTGSSSGLPDVAEITTQAGIKSAMEDIFDYSESHQGSVLLGDNVSLHSEESFLLADQDEILQVIHHPGWCFYNNHNAALGVLWSWQDHRTPSAGLRLL